MGDEQQFCLRWNNFQANITTQFEALRDEEDFVDVTLACEGQRIKAHKVVLSACSPYFKELFRSNPCKHPILFMRDVEFRHLQSLIEFMYAGEVNVAQAHLSSFLRTAESLQIRGLTEAPQRHKQDPKDKNDTASNALIQQLINNARPQSTSPRATSQNNTSSQEEEEDDDILSGSSSLSPTPSKRAREDDESATHTHLPLTISQPTETAITTHELEPRYNKGPSPEIFQPKTEAPDYNSDGESKGNFLALDNSMLDNSFSTMHSGLDMLAGPSTQAFTGDPTQDAALDCSSLPGLRRLHRHQPNTSASTRSRGAGATEWPSARHEASDFVPSLSFVTPQGMVLLGAGVEVDVDVLRTVNRENYCKMTRSLAAIMFATEELATCSVTGQRWSRAEVGGDRPVKPALEPAKIDAIIMCVKNRFPMVSASKIKQVLAYKCKEASNSQRAKQMKHFGSVNRL